MNNVASFAGNVLDGMKNVGVKIVDTAKDGIDAVGRGFEGFYNSGIGHTVSRIIAPMATAAYDRTDNFLFTALGLAADTYSNINTVRDIKAGKILGPVLTRTMLFVASRIFGGKR